MTPLPDRDTPWLDPRVTLSDRDYERLRHDFDVWRPEGTPFGPGSSSCNVAHMDAYGNPMPCPDALLVEEALSTVEAHRRLPSDDGNPGPVIALVVLAAIVAALIAAVLYFATIATPSEAHQSGSVDSSADALRGAPHERDRVGVLAGLRAARHDGGAPLAARRISGTATWYCGGGSPCTRGYRPGQLVAAIDTDLGFRKGQSVRVSAFGNSVVVRIVDVCACAGDRLIDLSREAFSRLADPDYGVIPVMLELAGPAPRAIPTAPATDR